MSFWDRLRGRTVEIDAKAGRPAHDPDRHSKVYAALTQGGLANRQKRLVKPTPRNLRYFSKSVFGRRAINAVKNPIVNAAWEIVPKEGLELNSLLSQQIETAMTVFESPNETDSFRTFVELLLEDVLCSGAAIEVGVAGNKLRPLFLWPVDGLSIEMYPGWTAKKGGPRYAQRLDTGLGQVSAAGKVIDFTDDELIYMRPNPTNASPYGTAPLEIAFNSISRMLGVSEFAGNVATNSRPSIGLDLGDGATTKTVEDFRLFWRNEVEGQGSMPIFAMTGEEGHGGKNGKGPSVLRFYPEGDNGLYLKYQDFLKAEIATAFDLSPMNLGVERDVNRSTADVAADRDNDNAIKPWAHFLEDYFSRTVINRHLGFSQLRFRFRGLDIKNQLATAQTFDLYYADNVFTPNEIRKVLGWSPSKGKWGDLSNADVEIEIVKQNGKIDKAAGRPASGGKKPNERA